MTPDDFKVYACYLVIVALSLALLASIRMIRRLQERNEELLVIIAKYDLDDPTQDTVPSA